MTTSKSGNNEHVRQIDRFNVTDSKFLSCEHESEEEYVTDSSDSDESSEDEDDEYSTETGTNSQSSISNCHSNEIEQADKENDVLNEGMNEPLQDDVLNNLLREYKSSYENMVWHVKQASGAGGDNDNPETSDSNDIDAVHAHPSGDH